jgi:hypothetical protein
VHYVGRHSLYRPVPGFLADERWRAGSQAALPGPRT